MINKILKYSFLSGILCVFLSSCHGSSSLEKNYHNVLFSSHDTLAVSLVNGAMDIKFSWKTNSHFRVNLFIKEDSLFIKNPEEDYFFLKFQEGFNIEHFKIPDAFIPFGNIVRNVSCQKNSYVIELDRGGPYTISADSFIYGITINKKMGVTEVRYFDGNQNLIFKVR